jgi:hypothetical protein
MTLDRPVFRSRAQAPHIAIAFCSALALALLATAGGVVLGLFSAAGDRPDAPLLLHWLANIPGPWVLLAFGVGVLAGTRTGGALAAVLALAAAVSTYYASLYFSGQRPWLDTVEHAAVVWSFVAVVAGLAFGAAGGSWRRGGTWERMCAVALLCGVLVGESLLLAAQEDRPGERLMVASEAVFAIMLVWLLLPKLRHRVVATFLTCGASVVAIEALVVFSNRLHAAGL